MTQLIPRHLFTVDDFYRMAEAGILRADDRLELIEGEIVEMAPTGSRHAYVVDNLNRLLSRSIEIDQAIVRVQGPVRLDEKSELLPDVALLAPGSYADRLPGPRDILLIVEVADSTLVSDQRVKVPLYAAKGVPVVWLVNLTNQTIEVHATPSAAGYMTSSISERGESLSLPALPSLAIAVDDILG